MKLSDAFPSNYISAKELDGEDRTLTISEVKMEMIGSGKDAENKLILHFTGEKKGMVLNKTNANTIEKLYGDDTDFWAGKPITLYATEVEFQGETMLGLRVRLLAPKKPNGAGAGVGAGDAAGPGGLIKAAKVAAFKAMKAKMPDASNEAIGEAVKDAVAACYPGQTTTTLGLIQWKNMVNRDFAPIENPVDQTATISAEDDIPF